MDNFAEILDWDSCFFGKRIAKITINDPDEIYIEEKLREYKSLDFDLVYVFLKGETKLPDRLCSLYHCKLVDCKVIYQADVKGEYEVSPFITDYQGEPSGLYELALQSGVDSRYRLDDSFSESDFEKLYKTWVDNSVSGLLADKVFIYKQQEQTIEGFVTVKIRKGEASIGLIATDAPHRGKGIGSQLLSVVKQYAKNASVSTVSVATQKQNASACAFYEKNGFILKNETTIYHAWLKNN